MDTREPDPQPYVGWSGRRYATEDTTWAAVNDGPVDFDPRPEYSTTEDER